MNLVIQQHKDLQQAVEAKQLYAELGLNSAHWAKWSQRNIVNNEFAVDGLDYEGFTHWVNGNLTQNFLLSIPFAKKLAMQVKTEKGETVRNYFLECEQKAQQPQIALPNFTDPAEAAEAWAKEYREKQALAITLEQAQPKINFYDKVGDSNNLLIASKIGQSFKTNPMSAVMLNKHLEKFDVYNMAIKSGRVFKQWFVDKGLGRMVQNDNGYPQAKFTTDGQQWITEMFTNEGII